MSPPFPLQMRHRRPIGACRTTIDSGPQKSLKQRFNAHSAAWTNPCLAQRGGGVHRRSDGGPGLRKAALVRAPQTGGSEGVGGHGNNIH